MKAESRLAVVTRILPRIYRHFVESQHGGNPHVVSYNVIICVPKTGTLPYLMVFFKFIFLALVVSRY